MKDSPLRIAWAIWVLWVPWLMLLWALEVWGLSSAGWVEVAFPVSWLGSVALHWAATTRFARLISVRAPEVRKRLIATARLPAIWWPSYYWGLWSALRAPEVRADPALRELGARMVASGLAPLLVFLVGVGLGEVLGLAPV